ncbi:MAG TPA: sugar ABC transporter substrate-binding protein [Pararhizobium sp.]|nr:sugar ABC transporter substrate-binding protein [Pararhizobium sp.]
MSGFGKSAGALALVASTALFGLTAAGHAADKITLTFANWAAAEGATRPGIEKVIAEFEKQNPNITIKSQAISFSEIARQLVLRVRSGNPPDVAEVAGNDTFLLAATGKLEPLDSHLDSATKAELKPSSINGFKVDGHLIAFPWTLAPAGLWYDKAIMQKAGLDPNSPPTTIDELMKDMAAIKKSQPDVIPLGLDTTNRPFSLNSNWPWMKTFGADPLAKGGADSAAMKKYLSWMRELARKGYIDPGRKIGEFRPQMAQDKVAFLWDQVLLQGVIQSTNKMSDAEFYKHYGVTVQPKGDAGKSFSFEGGHQLVMFSGSEHKDAAWKFIKFLSTSPYAIENYTLAYESSLMPLKKAPSQSLAKKLDTPVFKAFLNEIIPTVATPPFGPQFAAASTAIMAGVQQAVTGDQPIDGIAASIKQNLER